MVAFSDLHHRSHLAENRTSSNVGHRLRPQLSSTSATLHDDALRCITSASATSYRTSSISLSLIFSRFPSDGIASDRPKGLDFGRSLWSPLPVAALSSHQNTSTTTI